MNEAGRRAKVKLEKHSPGSLRLLGAMKDDLFIGPRSVIIDVTNRCNLNCLFCWYHSPLKKDRFSKGIDIPYEAFEGIIDDCAGMRVEEVVIVGIGDPIVHPRINDMIKLVKSKKMALEIFTNFACEKETLKQLARAKSIIVNLAATDRKTYESLQDTRSRGNFDKVMKNLLVLREMKRRGKNAPNVVLSFIINELNYHQVPDLFSLAKEIQADKIKFKILEYEDHSRNLILSAESMKRFGRIAEKVLGSDDINMIENNLKEAYEIFLNPDFIESRQQRKSYSGRLSSSGSCSMGWFQTYITINGDVKPCCRMSGPVIGNVYQNTFREIWESESYKNVRRMLKYDFDMRKEPWKNCRFCGYMGENQQIEGRLEKMGGGK